MGSRTKLNPQPAIIRKSSSRYGPLDQSLENFSSRLNPRQRGSFSGVGVGRVMGAALTIPWGVDPRTGAPRTVAVRVIPRAKRRAVEPQPDGSLLVRVTAPPEDGRANDAVLEAVAEHF